MDTCIECGKPLRRIPAGVSKNTGKPYQAFWACPDRHRQGKPQHSTKESATSDSGNDSGKQNAALEIIWELQGLRAILERIEKGIMG